LYRGLGTVLVGGMAVNSVFTLVLLPTLLRLIEKPSTVEVVAPVKPMEAPV
jgi:predicted RND superfamily exporter protein